MSLTFNVRHFRTCFSARIFSTVSKSTDSVEKMPINLNISLVGAPGSGKGTYGSLLSEHYDIPLYTASDFIRANASNQLVEGLPLKEYIERGRLLPDEIVSKIVFDGLGNAEEIRNTPKIGEVDAFEPPDNPGFIIDGYPRSVGQAKLPIPSWENAHLQITCVIQIDVPDSICKSKMLGRRKCSECDKVFNIGDARAENGWNMPPILPSFPCSSSKCSSKWETRPDDREEIAERRLAEFHEITEPVIDYYKSKGMLYTFTPKNGVDDFGELAQMIMDIEKENVFRDKNR